MGWRGCQSAAWGKQLQRQASQAPPASPGQHKGWPPPRRAPPRRAPGASAALPRLHRPDAAGPAGVACPGPRRRPPCPPLQTSPGRPGSPVSRLHRMRRGPPRCLSGRLSAGLHVHSPSQPPARRSGSGASASSSPGRRARAARLRRPRQWQEPPARSPPRPGGCGGGLPCWPRWSCRSAPSGPSAAPAQGSGPRAGMRAGTPCSSPCRLRSSQCTPPAP
mmetsp:Transcript_100191/g.299064  ORF Transcript_100191/g.299064 Transcript_100191/m.299064 type:complete len:220 (-) Transcript_100191:2082-2741(-)